MTIETTTCRACGELFAPYLTVPQFVCPRCDDVADMGERPWVGGWELDKATVWATLMGWEIRVTREDGMYRVVTRDYKPNRLNVEIERNVIVTQNPG